MRVLITVPWAESLGGAEAMLQAVLGEGPRGEHELELVFFEQGPWAEEFRAEGFQVYVLEAGRLRDLHRWGAAVLRLAQIIRRRRPDLILDWAAKTHLYGAPAAAIAGASDRVLWWQQAIPPRDSGVDICATLLPACAIGCYSRASAEAQARLRPRRDTFVVPAGAPIPHADVGAPPPDLPSGLAPGTPLVGLIGRLQPWKGQDRLLRAQALLRERGREMHLLIVGGDAYGLSSEYAASLPQLVAGLGLEDAVTMVGQVPDAGPYIDRLDVLVNASDPEPFGIVLLEGMARSVAVVAVDSGGPSEFVLDGRTGVLARSGDPADLADALEPLLASADLRDALGRAGRERFMEDFTDAAMRERFFGHLEALLAGLPPAPALPGARVPAA